MKQIKRFLIMLLAIAILSSSITISAHASDGSGNMDGGGGDMGSGTSQNIWHNGDDGIRVTVVRASDNKPVSAPFDMANRNEGNPLHFVKKSKLTYRNGSSLAIDTNKYSAIKPEKHLPTIITGNSTNNIVAIKKYFCSEWVIKRIADQIGTTYDTLSNGNYKLLLEPLAYFTFNGAKWSMTATEAAIYDQMISGGLRRKMVSLTHQNLPLSLFLEKSDMGWPAYKGSTKNPQSDSTIISSLGLGIVKFKSDDNNEDTDDNDSSTTYRVNTDVITSVTLSAGSEINPDEPASVTFHILGGTYTVKNIVIPQGESQLVWVKWHTPSTPQTVNITVSATKGLLDYNRITAKIESLAEHNPPNPTAKDRNDNFVVPTVPKITERSASSWGVWNATWFPVLEWQENWVWVGDDKTGHWADHGKWVDNGYWQYNFTNYHPTLTANMSLLPDDKVPTARGKWMRSGYGVKESVNAQIRSSAPSSHITGAQTAITYFPEFQYKNYWRLLDLTQAGESAVLQFKNNEYSTYNRRVHFTPLWYPDGKYTAYTYLEDAWTPAGMLCLNLDDYVTINGSVYDDWHIGPQLVD